MTNITNLNRLAKGTAESNKRIAVNSVIKILVTSFDLESVRDTLTYSLYSAFLSGEFLDCQKSSILLTCQELNRVLPIIFFKTEEAIDNHENIVLDDLPFETGRDSYLEGLRLLFREYMISDYTEGYKSKDRIKVRDQYAALESLIYTLHSETKREEKRLINQKVA